MSLAWKRLGVALAAAVTACCAERASITVARPHVRYISGGSAYSEELRDGRWLARSWTLASSAPRTLPAGLDAFEVRVKTEPSPAATPGILLTDGWNWTSASESAAAEGSRHCVIELRHSRVPVSLLIPTVVDGTPVITRWLEIGNSGRNAIALTSVAPLAGRLWAADAPVSLGYATRHEITWEGWFGWKALHPGVNLLRQEHGLAYDHPYFMLRNEANGEYFFGQLEWPVNRVFEFDRSNGLSFKASPNATDALRVIAPGETIRTPAVHLAHIKGDFDEAVQAMHDHIRRSVRPNLAAELAYRVQCLMPEDQPMTVYRGKEHNEANLKKFLDVASQLGIELFILDGPTWCRNYGDWLIPKPENFPNGLAPVVDAAHTRNILFGLYAEPEGGRDGYTTKGGLGIGSWKQSQVFQEHLDWFVQGVVLNLANPDAAAYLASELDRMIGHYRLDLYRHDFNTMLKGQGSSTWRDGFLENDYWRHYEAFNRIFDGVREKHPRVILQQASGGGTRLDLGTVRRFHEHYTSDRTALPFAYRMLAGLSVYLPPEMLVTPIGMAGPKERPDLDTMLRVIYAMGNTPMVFNSLVPKSIEELTPDTRERFLHYSEIYKSFIRPILPKSKVYHLAPVSAAGGVESGEWLAMQFMAPDRSKGWALVMRLSDAGSIAYRLRPKGLDAQREYAVTFDNERRISNISGANLMRDGLRIQPPDPPRSELLLFEAK
jgi:alpha-galactosidase